MKTCSRCNKTMNYSFFNKKSSGKDGYSSWCKECNKANSSNYYTEKKRVFKPKIKNNRIHCRNCDRYLSENMFYSVTKTYCMECYRDRENIKTLKRFNITQEQYDSILQKQGGMCKICKKDNKGKRLCIDHDHSCCSGRYSCGKCIRGLLCNQCNRFIGEVNEDIDRLKSMVKYITTYQ